MFKKRKNLLNVGHTPNRDAAALAKSKRSLRTSSAVMLAALALAISVPIASRVQAQTAHSPAIANPALSGFTPDNAVLVYVDYVTGLDNLMNTIPGKQYRNNIAAFAQFSGLFKMPSAILGEENDYYGTYLPEIKKLINEGGKTFAPRSKISAYTPDFVSWLESTGRKNVIIGGISIDNCTLHTSLDLLRNGYNVFVIVDVSSTNSQLAEDAAIQRLIQAGAVPVSWLNALTELGADFAGPYGKGMMEIVQANWPASTVGVVEDTTPDGHGMQLPK
jgi:Isochorismatase family